MSINGSSKAAAAASSCSTHALAGKTARPCDSCLIKRARWFCAADDAFLCQSCDAAVHSANQLASRHQRVRLETASRSSSTSAPAWHQGFAKKPRTPRHPKSRHNPQQLQLPLVPEMEENDHEDDHLLFCRVPVFDPFEFDGDLNLDELLSSCNDEFAADVESLLGKDDDREYETTALMMDINDEKRSSVKVEEIREDDEVEVEVTAACHLVPAELSSWDDHEFNYNMIDSSELEDRKIELEIGMNIEESSRTLLRLDYEAVIAAWSASPWADGIRPDINLLQQLHDHDSFVKMGAWLLGGVGDGIISKGRIVDDAAREARVSRYREKRRTRLFSKKIRYEVRKLNAEKRPRMKGRFVKRSSSSPNYHRIKS